MKRNAGYLFLLITFFCWGSIYIVSKYAGGYGTGDGRNVPVRGIGIMPLWTSEAERRSEEDSARNTGSIC